MNVYECDVRPPYVASLCTSQTSLLTLRHLPCDKRAFIFYRWKSNNPRINVSKTLAIAIYVYWLNSNNYVNCWLHEGRR